MNIKEFEERLIKEKEDVEAALKAVSKRDPENPNDWQAKYPDLNIDTADKSEFADEVEEFDTNIGVNTVLEERYKEITAALARIKDGTYGKCEKGGEQIDEARLKASPSAKTCIKHAKE